MLGIDIDELQKSFDAFLDKRFATLRRALKVPEGLTPEHAARQAEGASPRRNPESFAGADGARRGAARESNPDAAIAAFERAAKLVPNVPGEDSP